MTLILLVTLLATTPVETPPPTAAALEHQRVENTKLIGDLSWLKAQKRFGTSLALVGAFIPLGILTTSMLVGGIIWGIVGASTSFLTGFAVGILEGLGVLFSPSLLLPSFLVVVGVCFIVAMVGLRMGNSVTSAHPELEKEIESAQRRQAQLSRETTTDRAGAVIFKF